MVELSNFIIKEIRISTQESGFSKDDNKVKPSIFIVTFPDVFGTGKSTIAKLLNIIAPLSNKILLTVGNGTGTFSDIWGNLKLVPIHTIRKSNANIFDKVLRYLATQILISLKLIQNSRRFHLMIPYLDGTTLLLPILTSKMLKKKVFSIVTGPTYLSVEKQHGLFVSRIFLVIEYFSLLLADKVILESPSIINAYSFKSPFGKWLLRLINKKTHILHLYVESNFVIKNKIDERKDIVGFVGRFSKEKGILNFVQAISQVLKERKSVCFILCGDGEVFDDVKKVIQNKGLEAYVKLTGMIPHNDIPRYLNELKLLVISSYTEGLPNIMLEAMVCGTPVLATCVGAIPDVIKDGKTGFLLKSNNPEHIAERILELLDQPELLEKVSNDAYNFTRENFNYENTVEAWWEVFHE